MNSINKKALIVFFCLLILTALGAMAASNTVPATKAGEGSGIISGYVVTSVQYVLNSDPSKIDQVKFTLDGSATTVKAKLDASTTTYYACTVITGNNWGCATTSPQLNVLDADILDVVALQ
jgi:hypothetical protein